MTEKFEKLFYNDKDYIAYQQFKQTSSNKIGIIYAHGLKSDMNGKKSLAIEEFCLAAQIDFIKFDFYGHGESSGDFFDGNITKWYENLKLIITSLCKSPQILIGSSMGAWITTLLATRCPSLVHSMITIAAAPNFTEELVWKKLTIAQKVAFKKTNRTYIKENSPEKIEISYDLILDGKKNNAFISKNKANIPMTFFHGLNDTDVPYNLSLKLANKLPCTQIDVKLIKGADHRLSRDTDLAQIINEIKLHLAL
jgi:pimeloyl-ACP methyl ester carboxylesterase